MEILFALIGGLTAYFNYRNAKASGALARERDEQNAVVEKYEPEPLGPNATLLETVEHWLGIEDDSANH